MITGNFVTFFCTIAEQRFHEISLQKGSQIFTQEIMLSKNVKKELTSDLVE